VGEPALDPNDFLRQLKAEHKVLRWEPLPPATPRQPSNSGPTPTRASLEYLHANWALPDTYDSAEAGGGTRGKVLGLFGRMTYRVLSPYLRKERDLLSHVVRVNEALERRCDDLAAQLQELKNEMLVRQADEARNQAKLALWLHLDPPAAVPEDTASVNGNSAAGASPSTK
jgi:hypothetical protein